MSKLLGEGHGLIATFSAPAEVLPVIGSFVLFGLGTLGAIRPGRISNLKPTG